MLNVCATMLQHKSSQHCCQQYIPKPEFSVAVELADCNNVFRVRSESFNLPLRWHNDANLSKAFVSSFGVNTKECN